MSDAERMASFTESVVEDATLAWLGSIGFTVKHGPEIAPGEPAAERQDYSRLHDTLLRKLISGGIRVNQAVVSMEAQA